MDFEIDRRKLLKATGAGMATITVATGTAGAVTDLGDLPGDGTETNPYELDSFDDLLAIDQDLDANYVLTDNIEFEGGTPISPLAFDDSGYGYGYGYASSYFTGTLDGQGYEIRNFEIEGSSYYGNAGLFGGIGPGGIVKNLNIVNIDVVGLGATGGLVGIFDGGSEGEIRNVSVTGTVQGNYSGTGGLVGRMESGTVTDSSSSVTVEAYSTLGGAVGLLDDGEVTRTYAEGNVGPLSESNSYRVGGLIGEMDAGSVTLCFATGNATGSDDVGGFVGSLDGGSIAKAYARGDVTGVGTEAGPLGGFAGSAGSSYSGFGNVEEVYSSGAVTDGYGGGLIGRFEEMIFVGEGQIAPLDSHVTNGYWDVPASGQETSDGGVGLGNIEDTPPADEMTGDDAPDNMDGFDFENTWITVTGDEDAIIGFRPAETEIQIQATQPSGPGYPVFGWQIDEKCINRRDLGRGQEDEECSFDRDIERGGSRRELDRQTGRGGDGEHRDSETSRRDRGRGEGRGR